MASVKFSLRDNMGKKKSMVRMSVSFTGNRIVIGTGQSISPEYWDTKTGLPKSIRGSVVAKNISQKLKELDLTVSKLYDDLSNNEKHKVSVDSFKQKLLQLVYPKKFTGDNVPKTSMVEFMNLFIKDCEQGKRLKKDRTRLDLNTIKTYKSTLLHFINFQKKIKRNFLLNEFNQQIHDEFLEYLEIDQDLSRNSSGKYITNLNQIILYAVKQKLIPGGIVLEVKFETGREESDNIFLNEKEIQQLMNLKTFNSKMEEEVRDTFVLGCYTGLRFSNYSNMNLDFIVDEIYTTHQVKVHSKVTIPIHPQVRRIIDKYKSKLPECPTNQEFNRTLKDLAKRIPEFLVPFEKQITRGRVKSIEEKPKWMMIQTHTARRSFCTNMYLMGVPIPTIMAMSGHKSEKNFKKYIKASGLEHAVIIKKYWEENEEKNAKDELENKIDKS